MSKISRRSDIRIETYRSDFQAGILDLILNIQRVEFGISITAADQPDLKAIPDFYQASDGNFWAALDGDEIIGTIALKDIGNRCCALRKMFVHQAYRGGKNRIAKKLLDELMAWSQSRGIENIFLGTTSKYLAAHRFYEKNGFVEILKEELPSTFPVMTVDTKFYCYTLETP